MNVQKFSPILESPPTFKSAAVEPKEASSDVTALENIEPIEVAKTNFGSITEVASIPEIEPVMVSKTNDGPIITEISSTELEVGVTEANNGLNITEISSTAANPEVGVTKSNEGPTITEISSTAAIPEPDGNVIRKYSIGSTHDIRISTLDGNMDDPSHIFSIGSSQVKVEKQSSTTKIMNLGNDDSEIMFNQFGNDNGETMFNQFKEENFSDISQLRTMNVSKRITTSSVQSKTFSSISEIKISNSSEGEVRLRKFDQSE